MHAYIVKTAHIKVDSKLPNTHRINDIDAISVVIFLQWFEK